VAERIPMRYSVALQGFSDFEREGLHTFFRLAEQRAPAYEHVAALDDGDFVVADADQPASVRAVVAGGRLADTVFVGAHAPPGAAACLPRPIEPTRIVRELDLLLEQRLALLDEPRPAGDDPSRPSPLDAAARGAGVAKDVLVVDDSRIALKFLQVRLMRLGYRVHLARDSTQALDRLTRHAFALAFIDIALGPESPMDGLQLCQFMKQAGRDAQGGGPKVVLVTGRASAADRVRGELAGCDAYLAKPLMAAEFLQALRRLDPDFKPE